MSKQNMMMGKFIFMIKESSLERYKEICENYVGQVVPIDERSEIQLEDLASYKNRIMMH